MAEEKRLLVKTLLAAETAATAIAFQLVPFGDVQEKPLDESRSTSERRLSKQKSLLLQKLEVFKQINTSVRQQIKTLLEEEAYRTDMDQQVHALLEKMTQTERKNEELKVTIREAETTAQELRERQRKEKKTAESASRLSRSLEDSQAHLQDQLHNKGAENKRLLGQLKALERAVVQKVEVQELRAEVASVSAMASEEGEALRKAARAHKRRADKIGAAVEKCYEQMRDKDLKLVDARSERDRWRCQQEEVMEERVRLDAQITLFRDELSALRAELQRERNSTHIASEKLLVKVKKLSSEKAELTLHNSTLKASIVEQEEKLQESEAELKEQTTLAEKRKQEMEAYQSQVAQLHVHVTELNITLESLRQESKDLMEGAESEVAQVREGLQRRLEQLGEHPELLRSAEQSLAHSQEQLQHLTHAVTHKTQIIRQLYRKMEEQEVKLKSSRGMKDSIEEANTQLQHKVASLQKELEQAECENRKLIGRLASQEGALQDSSRQLEERSAKCRAVSRQLEGALTDVTHQVYKVKEKASSRESAFLARIKELESEKSQRENELRQIQQSRLSSEKQFEMQLVDLQRCLDQSESNKRSIQNYVDFLKNSYATMFEEDLPPSCSF